MHEIEKMTQMDIFYHAMNYTSKGIVDTASGGAFRRKRAEEATDSCHGRVMRNQQNLYS